MMMKKFALLAGLFVFAPMTWAQDYNIKNGLPSETYITCAEANEMAKTDSAQVAEIVAVMGNASVASRDLKIEQSPELIAKVVEKLNQVCSKDPQMLLITAIDDTMRAIETVIKIV
ncbi:YmgD family protein [Escherichia coli]|uniref:YmgD family protein n=1 Tax=Escherichia coli TaxID=562 RepID=UPI0039C04429